MRSSSDMISTTWGPPLVGFVETEAAVHGPRISERIEAELLAFMSAEIDDWKPERIIVVERRGTAIFRALKESGKVQIPWSRITSSKALRDVPRENLRNQRILVFDDMMRRGSHIRRVLSLLKEIDPKSRFSSQARIAVFAMHEDASSCDRCGRSALPDSWYYRGLTTEAYRNVRQGILSFLRATGSLMLDTEHIEIRVRLKGTFQEFVQALGRLADIVHFPHCTDDEVSQSSIGMTNHRTG